MAAEGDTIGDEHLHQLFTLAFGQLGQLHLGIQTSLSALQHAPLDEGIGPANSPSSNDEGPYLIPYCAGRLVMRALGSHDQTQSSIAHVRQPTEGAWHAQTGTRRHIMRSRLPPTDQTAIRCINMRAQQPPTEGLTSRMQEKLQWTGQTHGLADTSVTPDHACSYGSSPSPCCIQACK